MRDEGLVDPAALRRAREAAGLPRSQVARALGLAGAEPVYRWERGTHSPSPDLLPRMGQLYGVEVETLLHEGPPTLHRLRVAAGVTVTVAAEAVGVSVGTLRRWERGLTLSGPNDAAAQMLADLFGVSLSTVKAATQQSRARSR